MEAGLDGTGADAGPGRDLVDREVIEVAQHHDLAVIGAQRPDGVREGVAPGEPAVRIRAGQLRIQGDVEGQATPRAEMVAARVDDDPPEPRLEPGRIAELAEVAPCLLYTSPSPRDR